MIEKKFRWRWASFALDREGRASWGFGFRFGYWPCVGGPFVQLGLGKRRVSVWYGWEAV